MRNLRQKQLWEDTLRVCAHSFLYAVRTQIPGQKRANSAQITPHILPQFTSMEISPVVLDGAEFFHEWTCSFLTRFPR